jgi:hypothetical protein
MASLGMKRAVFGVPEARQFNAFARPRQQDSLAVLCYHGVVSWDRSAGN